MLSQETDFMCASFISGCAVSYTTLYLFNHFRLSDDERRKIGMLNCLLDRVKLELEIREFDAKLLRNKELENDTQDELCAVRIEIGKLEDEKDKVYPEIENLEDNMDIDDMQNKEPAEDMMDVDFEEHMLPEEPEDDPMEEIGLDSDEDDSDEDEEDQEDSDSDIGEDEEEEKPAVWPLDRRVRDYKLNELRDKEEELLEQLVTYQDLIEEQTIELEEMRERYDTLSEISTMEACGINFKTVLECKL